MSAPSKLRVDIKRRLNRRARARYAECWKAIQRVGNAVDAAAKVAATAEDSKRISWSSPSAEELLNLAKQADRCVEIITRTAKRWEAELVSRDWRK
jgi:hypothetical protein